MRETPEVQSEALTQNISMGTDDFDGVTFVPDGFTMPPDREEFYGDDGYD